MKSIIVTARNTISFRIYLRKSNDGKKLSTRFVGERERRRRKGVKVID